MTVSSRLKGCAVGRRLLSGLRVPLGHHTPPVSSSSPPPQCLEPRITPLIFTTAQAHSVKRLSIPIDPVSQAPDTS